MPRPPLALVCSLSLALLLGCGPEGPPVVEESAAESERPNLLLITLDTTRADRIGAYGYEAAQTQRLDALAQGGVRFDRAYAHVPLTLPSHASLLTGTFPPEHGIHDNGRVALGGELETLAELCSARGYRTGAFVAGIALDASFGLDRGFDVYDDSMSSGGPGAPVSQHRVLERPGSEVVDSALSWLNDGEGPFLAWVHFYDPHAAYEPPADFAMADPYDGEIAYVDSQIGRLVGWLDAQRLAEETLIVTIADHGESLGEKGEHTHGSLIYEGTQRIPLLFTWPTRLEAGQVVTDLVQQVDVLPTLLDLFDWPVPAQVSGRSFAPLLRGEELPSTMVYLESDYASLNFGWSPLRGVLFERWKYIQAPTPELYDVLADPGETRNLRAEHPDLALSLDQRLNTLRDAMTRRDTEDAGAGPELQDALSQLGYVQGRGGLDADSAGINPIERIEILELYHLAVGFGNRGQAQLMIEPLEKVVAAFPDAAGFRTLLGDAYGRTERQEDARRELEEAVKLDSGYDPAHFYLARTYESLGRAEDAQVEYRAVIELRPEYVPAREALAQLLLARGAIDDALEQYEFITRYDANTSRHQLVLADIHGRRGAWNEVRKALDRALLLAPSDAGTRNFYAWVLATTPSDGLRDGARAVEVAEALTRSSQAQDPNWMDTLAAAYAEIGRFEDAISLARKAAALAESRGLTELASGVRERLELYESTRPFRDR